LSVTPLERRVARLDAPEVMRPSMWDKMDATIGKWADNCSVDYVETEIISLLYVVVNDHG